MDPRRQRLNTRGRHPRRRPCQPARIPVATIEICNEPGPWAPAAQQSSAEVSRTLPDVSRRPAGRPSPHAVRHAGGEDRNLQRARRVEPPWLRSLPRKTPGHRRKSPGDPWDGPVPMPYDMPVARIETCNEPGPWAPAAQQSSAEVPRNTAERAPKTRGTGPAAAATDLVRDEDRSASLGRMSRPAGPHSVRLAGRAVGERSEP
jgi:hypothetical protein